MSSSHDPDNSFPSRKFSTRKPRVEPGNDNDDTPRGQGGNRRGRASRPGQTKCHRDAIGMLVSAGCSTVRFMATVQDTTGCTFEGGAPIMTPDAYRIDEGAKTVNVHEVEIWHPIDDIKWKKLEVLRGALAAVGWTLRVYGHDSNGTGCELDIDTRGPTLESLRAAVALLDGRP